MEACLPIIKAVFAAKLSLRNMTELFQAYLDSEDSLDDNLTNVWIDTIDFVSSTYSRIKKLDESEWEAKYEEMRRKARAIVVWNIKYHDDEAFK